MVKSSKFTLKYLPLLVATLTLSGPAWGDDGCRWSQRQTARVSCVEHDNSIPKYIFKSAATTIIGQAKPDEPLYRHYKSLVDGKTKPNLAKLTVARQIAAITLAVLKKQEEYDPKKIMTVMRDSASSSQRPLR